MKYRDDVCKKSTINNNLQMLNGKGQELNLVPSY